MIAECEECQNCPNKGIKWSNEEKNQIMEERWFYKGED
jgi:hypothetical protein